MPQPWPRGQIVGVIDLIGGQAVHAIAGQRHQYQPVFFCDGDPFKLVRHYRSLGVTSLYVADLDAIRFNRLQAPLLCALAAEVDGELLMDPGWSGSETEETCASLQAIALSGSGVRLIAATETLESVAALTRLVEQLGPQRVWLGLDFQLGELLVASGDSESDPKAWASGAQELGIEGVVVLDLAAVGKETGPVTGQLCAELKQTHPELRIYSGGGVRDVSDVERMLAEGCDRVLVATALQSQV